MRIISFRRTSGEGWICLCLVRRWRPIYDRWNVRFAQERQLAQWIIVDERLVPEALRSQTGGVQSSMNRLLGLMFVVTMACTLVFLFTATFETFPTWLAAWRGAR
jgi:hypothetical protein